MILKQILTLFSLVLIFSLGFSETSHARPEYAARQKNSCVGCHANVTGGGPRTIAGKVFGSRGLGFAKTSQKDWFYGDFRAVGYKPKGGSNNTPHMAIMKATASVNVNILENQDGSKLKAVASNNFSTGIFAGKGNARELYFQWDNGVKNSPFKLITVGRFYLPFGLLTDEHRTYTRIQTGHTYRDFRAGLMLSADLSETFHYDLSLTEANSGDTVSNDGSPVVGTLNLRWNPKNLPFLLGASGIYQSNTSTTTIGVDQRAKKDTLPWAASLYNVLVFDKISASLPKVSLSTEAVLAKNYNRSEYNSTLTSYVYGTATAPLALATEKSTSLGLLAELKWELGNKWVLSYKYEQLTLDMDFDDDRFIRHGLGVRYQFSSNANILLKYELADVGRNDLKDSGLRATQDAALAAFRVWF